MRKKDRIDLGYLLLTNKINLDYERPIFIDNTVSDYTIDYKGNVRSYKGVGGKVKILQPLNSDNGYQVVNLHVNGKQIQAYIHRLVALHFIPNPDNKPEVNHKDGNKKKNYVTNLEWATSQENIRHAFDTHLKEGKKGSKHHAATIDEEIARRICELLQENELTYTEIAKKLATTYTIVKKIKTRQRWKHVSEGYDFSNYIPEKERRRLRNEFNNQ